MLTSSAGQTWAVDHDSEMESLCGTCGEGHGARKSKWSDHTWLTQLSFVQKSHAAQFVRAGARTANM